MAVQEPPAEQDTPDNVTWLVLDARPGGLGVVWVLHRVPFHRTAQVPPGLANTEPVAVHADVDGHETPSRIPPLAPAGSGTVWAAHRDPFHASASGPDEPNPTATHDRAERQ